MFRGPECTHNGQLTVACNTHSRDLMPSSELHVCRITHEERGLGDGWYTPIIQAVRRQRQRQKALHKLDRPGFLSEFQASQHYIAKPCLKQAEAADECSLML